MWLGRSASPKEVPVVSTGSLAIDIALGIGGLPKVYFPIPMNLINSLCPAYNIMCGRYFQVLCAIGNCKFLKYECSFPSYVSASVCPLDNCRDELLRFMVQRLLEKQL